MIIFLNAIQSWLLALGIVLAVAIVLFLIFYLTSGFRKKETGKNERVIVDEVFISSLLNGLGSKENITSVSLDNGRVKFLVKNLDLLLTEELKKISTSGVFITGSNVKLLFKYDSNTIVEALVNRGVNRC